LTSTFAANQVLPQNRLAYAQASGLGDATNAAQAALRPFAELGTDANIAMFDRTGDSIYHSLQSQVRGRFGRGSHYQLSYTWSRLIDNALLNNSDGSISTDSFVDVTNPGIDRGPSELHRPHLLNASLVYLTPALAGANDFVRNVFGDWELANILVLSHGAALTVTTGTVPGLDGGPSGTGFADNNRPLRVAGVGCSSTGPLGEQILNPDAFTLAGFQLGQIGTAGRGLCYGPGNSTLDFAIYKNWNVPFLKSNFTAERLNIQFRAEMFNLFNKANFRNPSTTLDVSSACYNSGAINLAVPGAQPGVFCTTNPGFSVDGTTTTITSAPLSGSFGVADLVRDPRQIQFGLKLTF
jgi:hypothetical protein